MINDKISNSIITLTSKFVAFQTVENKFSEYEKLLSYLQEYLHNVPGIKKEIYKRNGFTSIILYFNNKKKSHINLNGHIDVVNGQKEQFILKRNVNILSGRGVYDMKAACAVFVELFKNEPELMKKKDVSLMIVSDEELNGENGTNYILGKGFSTDFCICGEPTDLMITKETKNSMYLKVKVEGTSAHSSRPWLGENPVNIAAKLINKVQTKYPSPKQIFHGVTVSITDIYTSSNSSSSIPNSVTFTVNVRFNPIVDENKIIHTIQKICNPHKVTVTEKGLPIYTSGNNSYIRKFRTILEKHGLSKKFRKGFGTADTRFYTQKGIPNIGFGLKGIGAHGDKEQLDISSIRPYYDILLDFIRKI